MQRRAGVPARASRAQQQVQQQDTDGDYFDTPRMPTSTRRYYDTRGNEVIQQGNRRIVIHNDPPPRKQRSILLPVGFGMLLMVLLFFGFIGLSNWWQNHQLDAQYGMPRTWQTDQVVGHSDSAGHPTHFIFLNLNGHAMVIETPGGDSSHARIYNIGQIYADNAASIPVTGEFKDVNGDGKVDMIVHIGDQRIVFLNGGMQFKPQQ